VTNLPGFGFAVSRDGSVVAGQNTGGTSRAYRIDSNGLRVAPLADSGQARSITPDGKIVAGTNSEGVFLWEGDTARVYPYEDPTHKWLPFDISADGRTVVGFDLSTNRSNAPTLLHDGVEYTLPEYLGLEGWTVRHARGISDDGRVLLGWTYTDNGVAGPGFIAYVPEPGFVGVAAVVLSFAGRNKRRR
jgi:uncharacterized membrane protein